MKYILTTSYNLFSKNKNDADFEIEKKVKVLSQVVDASKLHNKVE